MRQNFAAQLVQLLKRWLCDALQFSIHLIDSLSIILRCNGLARIQKAIVDQTGSRSPDSDHHLFFDASLALGSALELLLGPTADHNPIEKQLIVG
ncbi:hypothetical protein FD755_008007 [Muntiacus reevesi]|uniref:Uncharacterized protein n=1 Tax=Muntiacus reevesi TaxID=9886 RepID=A0A5J5MJ01_MUNRE|nr:hypothetical protein FD755_008007 [Muntiacus reevesi]